MPASSKTVRIELPAITPEPGAEGRSTSFAAPNLPLVGCGIEFELVKGTLIMCFLIFKRVGESKFKDRV